MSRLIKVIGCIVFTAWMFCPPALLTCAFCLGWDLFTKWVLSAVTFIEFVLVAQIIYFEVEDE